MLLRPNIENSDHIILIFFLILESVTLMLPFMVYITIVLPIYIGGNFGVKVKDRYHLEIYFNDELKWVFYHFDRFIYWRMYKREPSTPYTHPASVKSTTVILKIDQEKKYYELLQFYGTYYSKKCIFKANGEVNDDQLKLSMNHASHLSKLKHGLDLNGTNNMLMIRDDGAKSDMSKISICCGEKIIWQKLEKLSSPYEGVYDFDTFTVQPPQAHNVLRVGAPIPASPMPSLN